MLTNYILSVTLFGCVDVYVIIECDEDNILCVSVVPRSMYA